MRLTPWQRRMIGADSTLPLDAPEVTTISSARTLGTPIDCYCDGRCTRGEPCAEPCAAVGRSTRFVLSIIVLAVAVAAFGLAIYAMVAA